MSSENVDTSVTDSSDDDPGLNDVEDVHVDDAPADESGITDEVISARRTALLDIIDMLRPAVQIDGGDLELVEADYVNGVIEVELQGACGSCAVSGTTLTGGVERILKERLDWVTEVIGGVDEEIDQLESAALGRGAYVPKYY